MAGGGRRKGEEEVCVEERSEEVAAVLGPWLEQGRRRR